MNTFKSVVLILSCFILIPSIGKAQVDLSMKARATGFYGAYGKTYATIGYEPSLTLQPGKFWSGGISYSQNLLANMVNANSYSDLSGEISYFNVHVGAKRTVGRFFHPFLYAVAGFRLASYESDVLLEENNPALSSISLGYGMKTGLQIGRGKWRFEGSLELMSGTKARYLTSESFEMAYKSGGDYRAYAQRSAMTGVTGAVGVAYVLDWENVEF